MKFISPVVEFKPGAQTKSNGKWIFTFLYFAFSNKSFTTYNELLSNKELPILTP